jgi:RIO-like serine/threonine protein kinase
MPHIGSRKIARLAAAFVEGETHSDEFERVGSGSVRDALLHKATGVVYKVQTWTCEEYTNEVELRNARRLMKMEFEHVRVPKTSGFSVNGAIVIAMEMVRGVMGADLPRGAEKAGRQELLEKGRFADMHGYNFMRDEDGKIVPVDMGSPRISHTYADKRVLSCGNGDCW